MSKPDNREDNVAHLQKTINNTVKKLYDGQDYLDEHANELSGEEREQLKEKNRRRDKALDQLRSEIKDEAAYQEE